MPAIVPLALEAEVRARPDLPRLLVEASVTFQVESTTEQVSFLLGPALELDLVEDAAGLPLTFRRGLRTVVIDCPRLEAGQVSSWRFRYSIRLTDRLGDMSYFYAQTPWYPYVAAPVLAGEFELNVPVTAHVSVRVPEPWVAISSGRLTVGRDQGEHRYIWTQTRPARLHPLIIARLGKIEMRSGGILGRGFFSPENADMAEGTLGYALAALEFYGTVIGRYQQADYSIVELPLPPQLRGLTLPGLTLISSRDVDPTTPFPHRILAHEVGHLWWSIYVEFPRRSDYWLREGLPTYSAIMFLGRRYGPEMARQELMRSRRVALTPEWPEPLARGLDMEDQSAVYALNYHKGAFVLHMLRNVMGQERFTELLREFNAEYSGSSATTDDFRTMAEEIYGDDLGWFFAAWVESADVPRFEVRYSISGGGRSSVPTYEISGTIEQSGASVRSPVVLRVTLRGAPPLDHTVWLEPGTTTFRIYCPTPPEGLELDPDEQLLHRGARVELVESRH